MAFVQQKRIRAAEKELLLVEKQERKLAEKAKKAATAAWKTELEKKVPDKVYAGLESAFCKGFSLVFQQGTGIIEKSYKKEDLMADHEIRDYAVKVKGGRKEFRQMKKSAGHKELLNLTITTVEGIGLGALGVGMPDIVLFLSTLLKGIYETALSYGFDYGSREEQYLILKMMETSLRTGPLWEKGNLETDHLMEQGHAISDEDFQAQIKATGSAFAMSFKIHPGHSHCGHSGRCREPGILQKGHEVHGTEIPEVVSSKANQRVSKMGAGVLVFPISSGDSAFLKLVMRHFFIEKASLFQLRNVF